MGDLDVLEYLGAVLWNIRLALMFWNFRGMGPCCGICGGVLVGYLGEGVVVFGISVWDVLVEYLVERYVVEYLGVGALLWNISGRCCGISNGGRYLSISEEDLCVGISG